MTFIPHFARCVRLTASAVLLTVFATPARSELTWTQATANAAWQARAWFASVVFDGKMWVIGGAPTSGQFNDVWSSTDGANWTQATAAASWSRRNVFPAVVYDGRMWLMGGNIGGFPGTARDVWSSTNGVNWTLATSSAAWPARGWQTVVVFDNRLWLMGGLPAPGGSRLNDVWTSTDGAAWTQVTAAAAWSARDTFAGAVYAGRMWVLGGYDLVTGGASVNDLWSSPDGATWTQVTAAAPWSARYGLTAPVFAGRLWVLGGYGGDNIAWSSADGAAWQSAAPPAAWPWRAYHGSLVFDNRLWLMGGWGNEYKNDVWSTPAVACDTPSISQQPTSRIVCSGTAVTFAVTAAGTPPLNYQWRIAGVSLAGAAEPTYTIASAAPEDGGAYDVQIDNACGSIISDAATLTVWPLGTGDLNGDGTADGQDIAPFVAVLLAGPTAAPALDACAADISQDGSVDLADVPLLVALLLSR